MWLVATSESAAWENVLRRVDFDRMSSATSGTSNASTADILLFSGRSALNNSRWLSRKPKQILATMLSRYEVWELALTASRYFEQS
jgi:hypothetical protein